MFHVVAEPRSRTATRRVAQLVMLPEPGREAAILLDPGADDVVPTGMLPDEVAFRAAGLLGCKALTDPLCATERQGLQAALTGLWNRRDALPHLARRTAACWRRSRSACATGCARRPAGADGRGGAPRGDAGD